MGKHELKVRNDAVRDLEPVHTTPAGGASSEYVRFIFPFCSMAVIVNYQAQPYSVAQLAKYG
jgi:hypothetical protein